MKHARYPQVCSLFLLFCVLLWEMTVPVSAGSDAGISFDDVPMTSWYCQSVQRIAEEKLMIGTSEHCFSPEKPITGAEGLVLLARVHASLTQNPDALLTQGTPDEIWYQKFYDYCMDAGLLGEASSAILDTSMMQPLTRAQLLVLLSALPDTAWTVCNSIADGVIPDVSMSASYAEAVYRAYRAGITVGIDAEGNFHPDGTISRAEVAAILIRIIDPSMRLSVTLPAEEIIVYNALGEKAAIPPSYKDDYLAYGWRMTPPTDAFSAKALLNDAVLSPTATGYQALDDQIDAIFSKILTQDMTTYEKVKACYDYLVSECTYGKSPASGNHRALYRDNPYTLSESAASALSLFKENPSLSGDRGYDYFAAAVKGGALEAYTAMYAAELFDGMTGWCDHYSSAFAVMMRRIGLPCCPLYVDSKLGDGYKPHMTVILTVGGVDCIFDPQIEAVLVGNTGKNQHKRFCRPISEMTAEYCHLEDLVFCRMQFGTFCCDT